MLDIHYEVVDLEKDMQTLLDAGKYTIQTASGCGLVIASTIIGEIGDINRFTSPGALAKYAGCAPKERSSGKKTRHVKSRSGNRRLNCAFHRMALSQISRMGNEKAKEYFKRNISHFFFDFNQKLSALIENGSLYILIYSVLYMRYKSVCT